MSVSFALLLSSSPASANYSTENDPLFPEEILEDGRKHFATSNVEHEIKTYSNVPHGESEGTFEENTLTIQVLLFTETTIHLQSERHKHQP